MAEFTEIVQRLVALAEEKRRLEADLKQVNTLIEALEAEVVERMVESGTQSISTMTHTVYLARDIWARPEEGKEDELISVLDQQGLGDIARRRVMAQSLSAVIREHLNRDGALPAWAEGLVAVSQRPRARVVKR